MGHMTAQGSSCYALSGTPEVRGPHIKEKQPGRCNSTGNCPLEFNRPAGLTTEAGSTHAAQVPSLR